MKTIYLLDESSGGADGQTFVTASISPAFFFLNIRVVIGERLKMIKFRLAAVVWWS